MKSRYIHYYCQIRHDTTLGDHIIPTTITRLGRGTSRDTMFVWNSGDNMTSNIPLLLLDQARHVTRYDACLAQWG